MHRGFRVAALAVALLVLLGMGAHYDSTAADEWPYPTTDELAENYDEQIDQRVLVFGTVQTVDRDADRAQIEVDHSRGSVLLTVSPFEADVQPSGVVQVYGTVRADRTIAAENVAVVNSVGSSKLFKYGVSLVGAGLAVVLFLRQWRIDVETLSFEVRADG